MYSKKDLVRKNMAALFAPDIDVNEAKEEPEEMAPTAPKKTEQRMKGLADQVKARSGSMIEVDELEKLKRKYAR
jgi:hypothetical protein